MKRVTLKEITITAWKGITAKHVFGENENKVSGRNKSGKTSIMRAFYWLLSGYSDANSPANSNLFDNREELTPQTPTASVEAIIIIDGERYKIKRTATAKFTRKRGTDEYIKAPSDDYEYFIDDISRTATDFRDWLTANLASNEMLKFILDGSFFVDLCFTDKKRARQIIEQLIGKVERSEMKGEYDIIDALISKYSLEEIDMQAQTMCKSINARLNEIPVAIQSKQNEIDIINQTDFNAIQDEINRLEKTQADYEKQVFDLSARMRPELEKKALAERSLQMKKEQYAKAEQTYNNATVDEDNRLCVEISKREKENTDRQRHIDELKIMNANDENAIVENERARNNLRKQRDAIMAEKFGENGLCPTCGARLSEEVMAEKKAKFEEHQRALIESVVTQGKQCNASIDAAKKRIACRKEEISAITMEDIEPLKEQLRKLRTNDKVVPFASTEQGTQLQREIDAIVIPEVTIPDDSEMKAKIAEIKIKLKEQYLKFGAKDRLSSLQKEIDDLCADQREKGTELAKYERQRKQVKDYRQEQMEILSHKVNDGLKFSRIECWSQQKDGQMVPDIILKDAQGVNFATTNGASRLLTTLDIQRFFCDKLSVNMPCFLDEAAIINTDNIPHYEDTQMFYLFCADTSLSIESK